MRNITQDKDGRVNRGVHLVFVSANVGALADIVEDKDWLPVWLL